MANELFRAESLIEEDSVPFASIEQLEEWAKQEEEAWGQLWEADSRFESVQGIRNLIFRHIRNLRSTLQNARSDDEATRSQALAQIPERLKDWRKCPGVTSQSRFAHFLKMLASVDAELSARVALALSGQDAPNNRTGNADGKTILALYKMGLTGQNSISEVDLVAARSTTWDQFLAGIDRRWQDLTQAQEAKVQGFAASCQNQLENLQRIQADVENRIQDYERRIREQLALEGPVIHWTKMAHECKARAKYWGLAYGGLLLLGAFGTGLFVDYFVIPQPGASTAAGVTAADRLWIITLLLLIAGAVAWPLRLLAKLTMSNVHLAADAKERAVMAETYLALLDQKAVPEQDRKFVLASLFRTAATGIVHDDGAPSGALDAIIKVLAK